MTTEDFCSFEVAKLLKEKGFDKFNTYGWDEQLFDKEHPRNFSIGFDNKEHWISCPTHQMAMKWLREVHSIAIEPMLLSWGWFCQIEKIIRDFCKEYIDETDSYKTYEDAVEAALKYCLENLI